MSTNLHVSCDVLCITLNFYQLQISLSDYKLRKIKVSVANHDPDFVLTEGIHHMALTAGICSDDPEIINKILNLFRIE